jgi:cystathionine beta-lyase
MEHLNHNLCLIEEWAADHSVITFHPPEGTYLAWFNCREMGLGDRELREFFVQKAALGLSPGLSFGKEGSGHMRLNFAVASEKLKEALVKISDSLKGNRYV